MNVVKIHTTNQEDEPRLNEKPNDTNWKCMCYMHAELNSNAHWHNKIHNGDRVELNSENCHHTLRSLTL